MLSSQALRQQFVDFFADKGHAVVSSSSLIPHHDPTLLFTNAGMVPFKDVFLGADKRPYTRATSVQRCVRAGGKHNDLENVGYTARHHTFFEMLGNFSFGDYFKKDAIHFAWEFLTQVMKLPAEKLWITVYVDDEEAADIWLNDIGVDPARFTKISTSDNFWSMGDTGPCGPCSEIFYDHGEHIAGGPPGTPEEDGDRYVEIWNLVFMQYNRDAAGNMNPLPKPAVDTGMGLERLAAVVQGVHDNFDIDLFQHLIKAMAALAKVDDLTLRPLRVIADHIRATAFLIMDGVIPANEGRGYVLRRIMRRAIRYGHKLGVKEAFFYKLVQPLVDMMGEAYPDLTKQQYDIRSVIQREEKQFARTLDQGLKILEADIAECDGQIIAGETVFKLYDTYGFPVDLTADIAREQNLRIDQEGFEKCMQAQRERARAASQFAVDYAKQIKLEHLSQFVGYHESTLAAQVVGVFDTQGAAVAQLTDGQQGIVVLDQTPFYPEGGGQVGDKGELRCEQGVFIVHDTQKHNQAIAHYGVMVSGALSTDTTVQADIDVTLREKTRANHSATHLLHAALRKILGSQVMQKGSLVTPDRLRFDFSQHEAISFEQLRNIEDLVNDQVRANHAVEIVETTPEEAKAMGAMALFGEKYGDTVRVLKMGDFSIELCGGTHVARTGDIGLVKLISESGIAAGVRRIEGITGHQAVDWTQSADQICDAVADILNATRDMVASKLQQNFQKQKTLEKEIQQLKQKLASQAGSDLLSQVQEVAGVKVLAVEVQGVEPKGLRTLLDEMKQKIGSGIVVLGLKQDDKVNVITGVTKALTSRFHAGKLIQHLAEQVGGKGGGRPDMAQAGGNRPEQLAEALASVSAWCDAQDAK